MDLTFICLRRIGFWISASIPNMNILPESSIRSFNHTIYLYYRANRRSFPWRKTRNPYHILVSEIMLQQTQTDRVLDKYTLFLKTFPNFRTLAQAPVSKVLKVWQGLGYNRRAISLHRIAQIVVKEYHGRLPKTVEKLMALPGIGHYTASAICAFAFNQPTAFIETNIRRVYLHFFFPRRKKVEDQEILAVVEKTVDKKNPREWYYALMDYGVMLKSLVPNPNRRSAHYTKQSKFEGSNRQIRGMILKAMLNEPNLTISALVRILGVDKEKIKQGYSITLATKLD